jgi:enoyl-CoA hydratase/carnithine racemase
VSDEILLETDDHVATITVDRPEKRNSMDLPTRRALRTAFADGAADGSVRVVVLGGPAR